MFWDYSPSQSHDSTKARTVELCPPSHLGNRRFFPAIKCCRFNDDQTIVFLLGFLGLRRPSVSMPWPHFGDQFVAKNWTFSQGGHGPGESHGFLCAWPRDVGLLETQLETVESAVESSPEPHQISRRGMGDLFRSVSHIAIIVSDVGRWPSMQRSLASSKSSGPTLIDMVLGSPCPMWNNAPSGRDLIVSHIALDTNEPHKVLEKLLEYEVPLQNIPSDPRKGENLVEAFKNSEGEIIVRDPDGYYLELYNCDVPTAFCLFKENAQEKKPEYVTKYKKLMDAIWCHAHPCSAHTMRRFQATIWESAWEHCDFRHLPVF